MSRRKYKQALTLVEIMVVIFLIGLIGSVIGYNMKGSLETGRAFKTEKAMEQITDLLMLEVAKGASIDNVVAHPDKYLALSNIAKDPRKLLIDGWGKPFEITSGSHGYEIVVRSQAYESYKQRQRAKVH